MVREYGDSRAIEWFKFSILVSHLGLRDDADLFATVASLAFWPAKQLASGNLTICVPGIIDVSV